MEMVSKAWRGKKKEQKRVFTLIPIFSEKMGLSSPPNAPFPAGSGWGFLHLNLPSCSPLPRFTETSVWTLLSSYRSSSRPSDTPEMKNYFLGSPSSP